MNEKDNVFYSFPDVEISVDDHQLENIVLDQKVVHSWDMKCCSQGWTLSVTYVIYIHYLHVNYINK